MKTIILDIDGVMTSGAKMYNEKHEVIGKEYFDHDFTAIKLFQALGLNVCFISSDIFNKGMAESRGIDFFHSRTNDGKIDKEQFLPEICEKYNCEMKDLCYLGDDYVDLPIMKIIHDAGGITAITYNSFHDLAYYFPFIKYVIHGQDDGYVSTLFRVFYEKYATEEQKKAFHEIIPIR
jgi:3-deoxy-D-manno-octulosonate 8-phosphate phosphatase KdsC-like HAD superfamily phosphatase